MFFTEQVSNNQTFYFNVHLSVKYYAWSAFLSYLQLFWSRLNNATMLINSFVSEKGQQFESKKIQ